MAAPPASDPALDANSSLVNISCFDLLLIELVPLAERMARAYEASLDRPAPASSAATSTSASTSKRSGSKAAPSSSSSTNINTTAGAASTSTHNTTTTLSNPTSTSTAQQPNLLTTDGLPPTPIFNDSVYVRLERLGFRVGEGLSERFSRDRPRFTDHLDVIKFLCKDLWTVVFRKQIDNLKTNHRVRNISPCLLRTPCCKERKRANEKETTQCVQWTRVC